MEEFLSIVAVPYFYRVFSATRQALGATPGAGMDGDDMIIFICDILIILTLLHPGCLVKDILNINIYLMYMVSYYIVGVVLLNFPSVAQFLNIKLSGELLYFIPILLQASFRLLILIFLINAIGYGSVVIDKLLGVDVVEPAHDEVTPPFLACSVVESLLKAVFSICLKWATRLRQMFDE